MPRRGPVINNLVNVYDGLIVEDSNMTGVRLTSLVEVGEMPGHARAI
jgi:hypothetical protein